MSLKKPRADAKLLNLPEAQQAQLVDWLLGGLPYHRAREQVAKEFGVQVSSLSAFSQFYQAVCTPHLVRRRSQAVNVADQIAEEITREPGQFDAATVDAIKQKAFELAISPQSAPKDVKALFMLLQKSRDQDFRAEALKLDRMKLELASDAKMELLLAKASELNATSLSNREKIAALRQAYFADVDALGHIPLPPP